MNAETVLDRLRSDGVVLTLSDAGGIHAAPKAALTDEHRTVIKEHRGELLALLERLQRPKEPEAIAPRTEHGESAHATAGSCADCQNLTKHKTCGEPVDAGLSQKFVVAFPPKGYGKNCRAFTGRLRLVYDADAIAERSAIISADGVPYWDADEQAGLPKWTEVEVEAFKARQATAKRLGYTKQAEYLAEKLLKRDREGLDMRLCIECSHARSNRRCSRGEAFMLDKLQRCPRFNEAEA
jgi:hypothetical protein